MRELLPVNKHVFGAFASAGHSCVNAARAALLKEFRAAARKLPSDQIHHLPFRMHWEKRRANIHMPRSGQYPVLAFLPALAPLAICLLFNLLAVWRTGGAQRGQICARRAASAPGSRKGGRPGLRACVRVAARPARRSAPGLSASASLCRSRARRCARSAAVQVRCAATSAAPAGSEAADAGRGRAERNGRDPSSTSKERAAQKKREKSPRRGRACIYLHVGKKGLQLEKQERPDKEEIQPGAKMCAD